MSKLPVGLTRFVSRRVLVGKQNAPHILFVAGIAGFVGTTVLASRATLKVPDILDDLDDKKDSVQRVYASSPKMRSAMASAYAGSGMELVRAYAPAVIVGSASIICLTKSHDMLTKRNAALTAAYAALDQSYRAYRERIREHVGQPAEDLLYKESQREIGMQHQSRDPKAPNDYSGYARFFAKETSPSWSPVPEYNLLFLRSQQNYANDMLHARGHVFLNEIYDALGFDRSRAGAAVGWVLSGDGDNYIDFGIFDPKSRSSIEFVNGHEAAILLDFNVDGVIFDKI
jgi:hypothetical protein